MKDRLRVIAQAEGCEEAEQAVLDQVLNHADGDMRRAVTTLQSVHTLAVGGGSVDEDAIAEIVGRMPSKVVDALWTACRSDSFDTLQEAVEEFCASGFSAQLLLSEFLSKLLADSILTEAGKADIAIRMAEAERHMVDGADEYLQLMTVCSLVQTCFHMAQRPTN